MPSTMHALGVVLLALLPGALYSWAFERIVGRWGSGASDRLFRFVGGSAVLHALFAPATWWLWSTHLPLARADPPSWWAWPTALLYVAVPLVAGTAVGWGTRSRQRWALAITGPDPAPRAWDHLFQGPRNGWIRLRLKSGTWLGGAYASSGELKSYASGYPEPEDLFLAAVAEVDPATGEFELSGSGRPILGRGLLVRFQEVEYLEFIDA
ncbi:MULTISPECIES: DUF6338 family protein [Aeromicrobium]|uniref:Uncharacterized protein n=1 Tax=Aeromicrobium phoceense TaxID=2754045 RepID=A0A838XBV8_9ACTN|nr:MULTISPECIES: DUF6338 family protein [Aeromicrobium]MBA4608035.1 hypothetical protein [Aeromicrobium phoceense]